MYATGTSLRLPVRSVVQQIRCKHCMGSKQAKVWMHFRADVFKGQRHNSSGPKVPGQTGNGQVKKPMLPKASEIKRLVTLAKPEKWKLIGAVGFLFVSSGVSLAVPFCLGKLIDTINSEQSGQERKKKLKYMCGTLLAICIVGGFANFCRVYLIQISGQRVITKMRQTLFSSIMKQEVGFFDKTKTGELVNRLSTDTSLVGQALTMNISDGLRSVAWAVGGFSMMVFVSPKLAMIGLTVVLPIAVASRIYGRFLRNITKQVQDSLAAATQVAEERVSNIRTVRAFAQEEKECQAYDEKIHHVLKLSYKEAFARGVFWGFTGLSGNMVILSVFYAGGLMMTEAAMTVGDLSAFLLYAAYVGGSVGGLTSFYTEMMRGIGASTRLFELTDRKPLVPVSGGTVPADPVRGNIQFTDVSFTFPTRRDASIFSGLSLHVPAGSITAVVGPSGSGKSTLGALLLRFYDPDSGNILLDECNIRDLDPVWLRSQIGTVSQEPVLFSCSVAENIKYGAHDPSLVTMEMVEEAARQANAYNFVTSFPEGFDTLVGERGQMLSGGQRQRIAIARAILKNPKILLLDEATSALDAESEFLVHEALERLMVGRTVITIAHRLSTIKSADQIAVVDSGKIMELGSYRNLMEIPDGQFRKLVERQTITQ